MSKFRIQRRVPGQRREPLPATVEKALKARIRQTANQFGVSRSWVANFILCKAYGIKVESYFAGNGRAQLRRVK